MTQYEIMRRKAHVEDDGALSAYHPVVKRVLINRSISQPEQITYVLNGLSPPAKLFGLDAAVNRIAMALEQEQAIQIVGDYDVDGATSTTLAMEGLTQMGCKNVSYCVPNRFDYGYGLSLKLAQEMLKNPPNLVITVDNGISSIEGVALLKQHNIDVVVTDHHLPGEALPDAVAIVNPNQAACNFPSKMLAGVGVIFYLMLALRAYLQKSNWFEQKSITVPPLVDLLDLVALGTVADLVPLDENNRILVAQGVARMRSGKTRPGIKALMQVAKRDLSNLVANDLGYSVGPRLNAAGRLADIATGIECLLAKSEQAARQLADALDEINQQRKSVELEMQSQAFSVLDALNLSESEANQSAVALFDDSWHEGVVGLVASRVKDKTGLPAAIFAPGADGMIKGSCRSIKQVHIRDVLATINAQQPGLIVKFGGHAMAAGLSLKQLDFDSFQQAFYQEIERVMKGLPRENQIWTDGALTGNELSMELAEALRTLSPWGQAFPAPQFDGIFKVLSARVVGETHLKLCLQPEGMHNSIDGIAFRYIDEPGKKIDFDLIHAVYTLDVNEFRGNKSVQLIIQYLEAI
ncbi:MAG: single-stranded-DNA-specific exonuclease [Saprospiraceae bacterium]|jgi:single-stranded-DNA-specific exonuclease